MSAPPSSSPPSDKPSSLRLGAPEPGTVIAGKYRVVRTLGSGGMGLVLAAHHLLLDQRIAIKCLTPAALEYPDIVERFAREARAAARIRSEHVARVIDVDEFDNGLPFIVLEYLEGEDLADHIERVGPLRVSTAVRFLLEACEVMAEAHAAGIVHRDIKPANLFIAKQRDKRRIIKVLDFGISKLTDEPVTQASAMLGTVTYMSPEQLRSAKEVDHRTDIWALGAVLYECLSGVAPFGGTNTAELIASVFSNEPKPLRSLREDLPDGLVEVVERCLRSDPAERFDSVLAMATELGPFAKTEDRASVDTIRRVTGASIAPASSGERNVVVPSGVPVVDDDGFEVTNTMPFSHPDMLSERPVSSSGPSSGSITGPSASRSSGRISASLPQAKPASGASRPVSSKTRISAGEPSEKPSGSTTAPVEAPSNDARSSRASRAQAAPAARAPIATYVTVAAVAAVVAIIGTRALSGDPAPAVTPAPPSTPSGAVTAPVTPPPPSARVEEPTPTSATTEPTSSAAPTTSQDSSPAMATGAPRPAPVAARPSASAAPTAPAASSAASAAPPPATPPPASAQPQPRTIDTADPWGAH